jgi:DNA-binding NarL/FixJ family response regulator
VGDGDAAVQIAADEQPEVVVLDLEMPGPDPEALLIGLRRAAPDAALVTYSGHRPADVAGAAVGEIALHVPKTTDLTVAAKAGARRGRSPAGLNAPWCARHTGRMSSSPGVGAAAAGCATRRHRDDDAVFRSGVRAGAAGRRIVVIAEADNGRDAIDLACTSAPTSCSWTS